jgi:hypothetical protein
MQLVPAAALSFVLVVDALCIIGCQKTEAPVATASAPVEQAQSSSPKASMPCDGCIPVTADNFPRAESSQASGSSLKRSPRHKDPMLKSTANMIW